MLRRITKSCIVAALLLLALPAQVDAQRLSNSERRNLNKQLLDVIEEYEISASLYDEEMRFAFTSLFESEQTQVYCDIMDEELGTMVPLERYVRMLSGKSNLKVVIKKVSRDDYVFRNGKWRVNLFFDKEMRYSDANGVLFSTAEYFDSDYNIKVSCYFDEEGEVFVIDGISGIMDSKHKPLGDKFWVINRSEYADLIFADAPLRYNSYDQAFAQVRSLEPWNDNVVIRVDTVASAKRYQLLDLGYKLTPWRVVPRIAFGLNKAYSVKGAVQAGEGVKRKGSAFEVGADVGYTMALEGKSMLGVYTGLGISTSSLDLGGSLNSPIQYGFQTMDGNGVLYNRNYEITAMRESISYVDFVMPLYGKFDYRLNKHISLSAHAGVKLLFNLSAKLSPFYIEGTVWEDYGTGAAEEQMGMPISGEYSKFLRPSSYARNGCDVSFIGGLSGTYTISNSLYAYLKVAYEYGLAPIHKGNGEEMFNAANGQYPVVYAARLNENIATQSYMNIVEYRRNIVWLELGVNYKF